MKNVAYWWVFFWAQIVAVVVAYYYGFFTVMWENDISKLSIAIGAILIIGTFDVGIRTHQALKKKYIEPKFAWYLADLATNVGFAGTLIGFIVMFSGSILSNLQGVVTGEDLKVMLVSLAIGIGTAVWTTLAGLIASSSIKFQLNNLEILIDRAKRKDSEAQVVLLNE